MSLGSKPPRAKKIRTYSNDKVEFIGKMFSLDNHDASDRDITIDVKFQSKTDLQFTLHAYLIGLKNTCVPFLVTDLYLNCWLRLQMRLNPYGEGLFEFVRVSALNDPEIVIGVQPLNSLATKPGKKSHKLVLSNLTSLAPDLMQIPLLREWLNITFVNELRDSLRYPKYLEFQENVFKVFLNSSEVSTSGDQSVVVTDIDKKKRDSISKLDGSSGPEFSDSLKYSSLAPVASKVLEQSTLGQVVDSISKVKEAVATEIDRAGTALGVDKAKKSSGPVKKAKNPFTRN